jgi:hypothetical protein
MVLDITGTRWSLDFKVGFLDQWRDVADKFKAFLGSRIQMPGVEEER